MHKYKILLAEYDGVIADELKSLLLKDSKYEVFFAKDGIEALKIIKQNQTFFGNKLACIILSLKLPLIEGGEILKILSLKRKTAKIPVIICSSHDDLRPYLKQVAYLITGYIDKLNLYQELPSMLEKICVQKDIEGVKKDSSSKLIERGISPCAIFNKPSK